jgi:type VI secretion system protein
MFKERLLERIKNLEEHSGEVLSSNASREISSISLHLQKLLNTHQGSVLIAEDYGVPDLTNLPGEGITDAGRRIERVITNVIRKYEPRLSNIRIKMESREDDLLTLRFKLEATLAQDKSIPVVFETVVRSDGKVNIAY